MIFDRALNLLISVTLIFILNAIQGDSFRTQWRSPNALHPIQEEMKPYVGDMIDHAFNSYITHAFPKDELCAVSGTGKNTMGGYGWTLIDSLDTLAISGRHQEFRRYSKWVEEHVTFDLDVSVSAFETTIRALGGLLAAHFMYEEGVVDVVPGEHDYKGGLLRLATDLGNRLLPVFNTTSGLPYGAINLRRGVRKYETTVSHVAMCGTLLVEMTALSRVTGDERYERAARRAAETLFGARNPITGLMGNHIDIVSLYWAMTQSHVSGAIDSAIEYFIKAHSMSGVVGDWERFERTVRSVNHYIRKGGMLTTVNMHEGSQLETLHDSLASFYPGNLLLGGHHEEAVESNWPVHSIFKHFGAIPERFPLHEVSPTERNSGYPLRPEHAESVYILYRATRDPVYLAMGRELALAINLRTRTQYGFSVLRSVGHPHHDGLHEDTMESFMIAETLKYLYLLFDECNPLHVQGRPSESIPPYCTARRSSRASHVGWVFSTEAHLFPNTAEWWARDKDRALHDASDALRRERLDVIDGLLRDLESERGAGRTDRGIDGVRTVTHSYYCASHAPNDLSRMSKSIFR